MKPKCPFVSPTHHKQEFWLVLSGERSIRGFVHLVLTAYSSWPGLLILTRLLYKKYGKLRVILDSKWSNNRTWYWKVKVYRPSPVINFCKMKRTCCHTSWRKYLGKPFPSLTRWNLGLRSRLIWSQFNFPFLNHLSPSMGKSVALEIDYFETINTISPTWALSPSNILANCRVTSSSYPLNRLKNWNQPWAANNSLEAWKEGIFCSTYLVEGSWWSIPMLTIFETIQSIHMASNLVLYPLRLLYVHLESSTTLRIPWRPFPVGCVFLLSTLQCEYMKKW